jgi:hypothetical protein
VSVPFRLPWFAFGFVVVLVIGATIALGGVMPSSGSTAEPTTGVTVTAESSLVAGHETAPASPGAPSMSPAASAGLSPMPSGGTGPTAKPTPTLDWVNVGYSVGVRDPVALGAKAKVTILAPVGPTCTVAARYPNGKSASVGSPTHPRAGAWVWSWTVPSTAGLGSARYSFSCTYAGLAKPGTGTFDIVAAASTPTPKPTATPTWSISGAITSPVSRSNGTLTFTGHVHGTPPPGIAPIDLYCQLFVTYGGTDTLIDQNGSVQTADFALAGPIGYPSAGTYAWHVTCAATLNAGSRSASGTFEAQ